MAKYLTLALLFVPAAASADCGHLFCRKQVVVVQQQVVAVPVAVLSVAPVYYAAGEDHRLEAAVERVLRAREAQDYQQKSSPQQAPTQAPTQAPPPPPAKGDDGGLSLTAPPAFQAFAKCARCHTGPEPKAGLTLNGRAPISAEAFRRWGQIAGQGVKVPAPMKAMVNAMTPEEKGAVADAMLNSPEVDVAVPPAPVPAPLTPTQGDLQ